MKKLKEKLKYGKKGITLIALVITIIVLLILAGVSIATLTGDNGILTQANEAKTQTFLGEEFEKIKLAVTEAQISDTGYQKLTFESLQNSITHQLGENTKVIGNNDGSFSVKIQDRNYNVSSDGKVYLKPSNALSSIITSQNYGDKVNYNANGISDWKIFYNSGNNVFIIPSDYIDNTTTTTKTYISSCNLSTEGNYNVYWEKEKIPNSLSENIRKDQLFESSFILKNENNSLCISKLLDTSNWKEFVDTNIACYAIGGPTLEMYVSSWNEKGYSTLTPSKNDYGYKINGDFNINMNSDTGYKDSLYYPHQSEYGMCKGYRLSSPGGLDYQRVMHIGSSGYVSFMAYSNKFGLRPVVCLKNTISGVWSNEKNEWILE